MELPGFALAVLGEEQPPPIAIPSIQDLPGLPKEFFCRPAEEVAPELVGCLLVNAKHVESCCGV